MYSIKIFTEIIKGISQNKSLCRILQNYETKKLSLGGNIIEFGAEPSSTKNFSEIGELPHSYNLLRYSIKEVFILIEQMACTLITAFWAILAEILHRFVWALYMSSGLRSEILCQLLGSCL